MKSERSFIQELEQKAKEQQKLANTEMIPKWAKWIGDWLATNPWRVLIPVAGISYTIMRLIGGVQFRELVLGLFGGFK
jgi:hypothetical protein